MDLNFGNWPTTGSPEKQTPSTSGPGGFISGPGGFISGWPPGFGATQLKPLAQDVFGEGMGNS